MYLKISSGKWRLFCLGPNMLTNTYRCSPKGSHRPSWNLKYLCGSHWIDENNYTCRHNAGRSLVDQRSKSDNKTWEHGKVVWNSFQHYWPFVRGIYRFGSPFPKGYQCGALFCALVLNRTSYLKKIIEGWWFRNKLENVVWKMADISSRPQCVKSKPTLVQVIDWYN